MTQSATNSVARRQLATIAVFLLTGACSGDTLTAVGTVTDEFQQSSAAQMDVLWVVDNSESMANEQAELKDNFDRFIQIMVDSDLDFHIGVISTDVTNPTTAGVLHKGSSNIPYLSKKQQEENQWSIADMQRIFGENVTVGINGARRERAFQAAAHALGVGGSGEIPTDPSPPTGNEGFIRGQRTSLVIIMVSDEDDKSFGPVGYYARLFEGYKGAGNDRLVRVMAIVGDEDSNSANNNCFVQETGRRYNDLVRSTVSSEDADLSIADICQPFGDALENLSKIAIGLKSRFKLGTTPNLGATIQGCGGLAGPMCVRVEGEIIDPQNGVVWRYDADQNWIQFGAEYLPRPQQKVTVEYREVY